jgi:predicted membrane-bound spermidine synthase
LKASILYRTASVLLLLFAAGHSAGFLQIDPSWGVNSMIMQMRSTHFDVQGSNRTYWDFYVGFGLFVSVFLLFSAVLVWQLGGLPAATLAQMRGTAWALVICFGAVAILSFKYFFVIPVAFSIAIFVCLTAAAWLSAKPA